MITTMCGQLLLIDGTEVELEEDQGLNRHTVGTKLILYVNKTSKSLV